MKKSALPLLIFILVLMSACVSRPKGVLSDEKMAPVIADMELAEAYLQSEPIGRNDERKQALIDNILKKHGISKADFDSTMAWYGRNVDDYYALCDLADKEIEKKKKTVSGAQTVEIATSDLWPYEREAYMSYISGKEAFDFDIPTSEVEKGQRLNLKLRINNNISASTLFGVEYDDGSIFYVSRPLHETKRVDLTFQTDTAHIVTRIFGNILLSDRNRLPLWMDSISLQALPYDSMQYFSIHSHRRLNTLPLK